MLVGTGILLIHEWRQRRPELLGLRLGVCGCKRVGAEVRLASISASAKLIIDVVSQSASRQDPTPPLVKASITPIEALQTLNAPIPAPLLNGNGIQTQTVDNSIPAIKAYLEYKGYDADPEQAIMLASMSALLRKTKMAQYFLGADEPWVLLRDTFNTEFDLQCHQLYAFLARDRRAE
ncbi:hypothetical protein QFC24_006771 [Naganishia onofrii]|uniref:Uncharacterized protein n=1 Tax=Naganishia onofrii TaxID=1851511 RepID=A0ACC2WXV5_9TREE|nr:hypothetical protein QFC24_006771 [Naganishia onofrii]